MTMNNQEFNDIFIDALERIDPLAFAIDRDDTDDYSKLYDFVEKYAFDKKLLNTSIALPLVRATMSRYTIEQKEEYREASEYTANFQHCLSVTRILIDLHIALSKDEEDIMLAAALCHILPETTSYKVEDDRLTREYYLDPRIHQIVATLYRKDNLSGKEEKKFYQRIQSNKLALLIALADRGNLMGQLYGISSWNARRYIYDTRNCYFPMSVYAKEHYLELLPVINVLTEKMRSLIVIAEILLSRYEARETELVQEMLLLREDNARLKGLILKHGGSFDE